MRLLQDHIFGIHVLALSLLIVIVAGCAGRLGYTRGPVSESFQHPYLSRVGQKLAPSLSAHPGQSGFYLLPNNLEALAVRAAMAEAADKTLDAQYYLYHRDQSGLLLSYYLLKAADRGVRVRLLIDDMDTKGRDFNMALFDRHPNVEIRLFNPFSARGLGRLPELIVNMYELGRRMHNKAFIADNSLAVLGGRNIGDEYFSARRDMVFADLDVLAVGPVVMDVSKSFDKYWNSAWAVPIRSIKRVKPRKETVTELRRFLEGHYRAVQNSDYIRAVKDTYLVQNLGTGDLPLVWADAGVYYDLPQKIGLSMEDTSTHQYSQIGPIFAQTSWELILVTPYFVPGKEGVEFFRKLRAKNVRVKVLTNSLAATDVAVVHAGYAPYREELLKLGVELYELKPNAFPSQTTGFFRSKGIDLTSLHAKTVIIDRQKVFIGTSNMDPRSLIHNTEITVMINSGELARQVIDLFESSIQPDSSYRLALAASDPGSPGRSSGLVWITEQNGRPMRYYQDPMAGFLRRLGVNLVRILPIENLL